MRLTKENTTFLLIIILVMTVQTARFVKAWKQGQGTPVTGGPKSKGNPRASIKVVEYSDFQCSACSFGAKSLSGFFHQFPDKLFVEFRHFPLPRIHKNATRIAVGSQCAAQQGKFWLYHDKVFERQKVLMKTIRLDGMIMEVAQEIGLDQKKFSACMADPQTEIDVLEEKKEGVVKGVKATPTFFINGDMVLGATAMKKRFAELLGIDLPVEVGHPHKGSHNHE